ncbi:MAG: class I SAM-dependent methyltransferase [bacterium]
MSKADIINGKHAEILEAAWYPEQVMERTCDLVSRFTIKRGSCVLNIGTKTEALPPLLERKVGRDGRIFAMDRSYNALKKVKKGETTVPFLYIQADIEHIPLPDDFCDLIICFAVFPNLPDKRKALLEVTRVLKNKGTVLIAHLIRDPTMGTSRILISPIPEIS